MAKAKMSRASARGRKRSSGRGRAGGQAFRNPYYAELKARKFLVGRGSEETTTLDEVGERLSFVRRYAWAIPNDRVIEALVRFGSSYVEIGAGGGYWARVLSEAGVVVYAFDNFSARDKKIAQDVWYPVERGGPNQAGKHPESVLLLVWPPHKGTMGSDAIKSYLEAGGRKLVVVGEGEGGCTGDSRMFELIDAYFREVGLVFIPTWYGVDDVARFYVRASKPGLAG